MVIYSCHCEGTVVADARLYADAVLADVHAALSARRPHIAMRLFEQILASGQAPDSIPLTQWITSSIGREGLSGLALAYATGSCSYCTRGRRECSPCDGTGRGENGIVCRACLGMRREPCETCRGTGLSGYGKCPDDLRSLVLSYRLCIAASGAARLVPEDGASPPELTVEACLHRIANLNKLAGVLDSAAVELAGQQARGLISPARLERVKQRIGKTYDTLDAAIRVTLKRAVELSSLAVGDQSPDVLFYSWLARSSRFEGTALHRNSAARLASRSTI